MRSVIAFSGFAHAGKTTAARRLEEILDFCYCRPSMVLAEMLSASGRTADRAALQELGNEMHASGRQRLLIAETIAICSGSRRIAADGIRWSEDREYLSEVFGNQLLHVHIEVEPAILVARHIALGGTAESYSALRSHDVEAGIEPLSRKADLVISNNGSLSDFRRAVDVIARNLISRT